MEPEERAAAAKESNELRGELIKEYMGFIKACAAKTLGRTVSEDDDACSVAMIAFNEAITQYDPGKGRFLSFAAAVIKNKVTDYLRKEYSDKKAIPFSSLSSKDDKGNERVYEIEDRQAGVSEAGLEINSVSRELEDFGISFFELPKASPKFKRTKIACMSVINYLSEDKQLIKAIREKKTLPAKSILENVNVNSKLLERHRKYIIAGVIILTGGYEILPGYLLKERGVNG